MTAEDLALLLQKLQEIHDLVNNSHEQLKAELAEAKQHIAEMEKRVVYLIPPKEDAGGSLYGKDHLSMVPYYQVFSGG